MLTIMLVAISMFSVAFIHSVSADASVTIAAKLQGVPKDYRTTCGIYVDHFDQSSNHITLTTGTHRIDLEWDLLGYDPTFLPYTRWADASTLVDVGADGTITYVSGSAIEYNPLTKTLTFNLDIIPINTNNWIVYDIVIIAVIVVLSLLIWKVTHKRHRK